MYDLFLIKIRWMFFFEIDSKVFPEVVDNLVDGEQRRELEAPTLETNWKEFKLWQLSILTCCLSLLRIT